MITLILYDLQTRIKSFLFWVLSWSCLSLFMAYMFEPLREQVDTEQLLQLFDPELLEAFNIPLDYLDKVENFIGGEFLTFFAMIGGIFAIFCGINRVYAKIQDKTLSQLLSSEYSRLQIYLTGVISNLFFFFTSSSLIGLAMYVAFSLITKQEEISIPFFVSAFFSLFVFLTSISAFGQLLGLIVEKGSYTIGVSWIVISWFLDSLSILDGFPDWLKPFSIFYFLNLEDIVANYAIDWFFISILSGLWLLFVINGSLLFNKKNISF